MIPTNSGKVWSSILSDGKSLYLLKLRKRYSTVSNTVFCRDKNVMIFSKTLTILNEIYRHSSISVLIYYGSGRGIVHSFHFLPPNIREKQDYLVLEHKLGMRRELIECLYLNNLQEIHYETIVIRLTTNALKAE